MSPISYEGFAFPKGTPRVVEKHVKKARAEQALKDAYALVDKRDKKTCRATGRPLQSGAIMAAMRLEHHHLRPRSLAKDLTDDPSNICSLAADVHQLVTLGKLEIEGDDADGRLVFHWAKGVPKEQRIVVLLSKRKSQRRAE